MLHAVCQQQTRIKAQNVCIWLVAYVSIMPRTIKFLVMTKKEIIIKAWMDLNIETPFGICDKTGWVHGYFCNGIDDIINNFGDITEQIEYDIEHDGVGKFRPKSLQGIENNNGWIKLEGKANEIESDLDIWIVNKYGEIELSINTDFIDIGYATHYQPIIKPDLPLY